MPQAHNLPPSLYMFKQLLKVKDISQIEHHSCELGCTGWGVTPKHDWHNCKDHVCSKCGGKRFKTVMGRLVPVRVRVLHQRMLGLCAMSWALQRRGRLWRARPAGLCSTNQLTVQRTQIYGLQLRLHTSTFA